MLINRFVFGTIEGRILAGVITYVAVMILVGWVAINEPARMASFEKQHLGRSIERGGELFAANCSTCHGRDGLGIAERAPALNNPMMFGFNFLDAVNKPILEMERQWNDLDKQLVALNEERNALTAELGTIAANTDEASKQRVAEITARVPEINALINPDAATPVTDLQTERTALTTEQATLNTELAAAETTDARKEEINTRLAEITARREAIQQVLTGVLTAITHPDGVEAGIAALKAEQTTLTEELADEQTTDERKAIINVRLAEIQQIVELAPTVGSSVVARIALFQALLEPMYVEREKQIEGLLAAVDKGYLPQYAQFQGDAATGGITEKLAYTNYLINDSSRLSQISWGGDLAGYIRTTLIHGRPGSGNVWNGNIMVAWSQLAGGPLRSDQIDDLVNYILNWDKGDAWTAEDLFAVNQFAKLHGGETGPAGEPPLSQTVDVNDMDAVTATVMALTGDPAAGQAIYEGQQRTLAGKRLGCSSCHLGGTQAPATEVTWANVVNLRLSEPQFAGWTPEKYIADSILHPGHYVVSGYADGIMPTTFADQLTAQDLANIIAFLKTYAESE